MRVIGAGFGRTGTETLKAALERLLGGNCYHMKEVLAQADQLDRWVAFAEAGRKGMDWHILFDGYEACVDWPVCNYYREILDELPDALVVLSVREPNGWFDSFQTLVRLAAMLRRLRFVPKFRKFTDMIDGAVWHIFDDVTDRQHCVEVFEQHIEAVKQNVPPDRLLVYRVQEGWAPLCDFLGAEVPDEPFPRLNSRADLKALARRIITAEVAKTILGKFRSVLSLRR